MPDSNLARLLGFARRLQPVKSVSELLLVARDETRAVVGYDRVWFMVADEDNPNLLRLVEFSGKESAVAGELVQTLNVEDDAFIRAVLSSDEPVVIEDARTDPRTDKRIVNHLQNRTIIKIPIRLVDKPWGLFGMGTFGDEGCRPPSSEQLSYLVGMCGQLAVAASRLRFVEAEQRAADERLELERRLQRIQKLESLGTLAGGIAHDFNNLLTVISAGASFIETDTEDPRIRENIQAVLHAADRGAALTRQLLAMSRTQALEVRKLEVNAQLEQLLTLARRLLPASIETQLNLGNNIPTVDADPAQLDQVFMNLIINARDAMPNGGRLTLETSAQSFDEGDVKLQPWAKVGNYTLVTVTDTGIGMSKEVLERAFEPFFTTKDARVGTGLGLAVAYGIVQQHGGLITAYSELGQGTTFNVYLRAAKGINAPRPLQSEQREDVLVSGHEHVLIADDDEFVRQLAERILARAGYRLTVVSDGASALRAAQAQRFDLALLDVVMPGLQCDRLLAELSLKVPALRVLLSSGYAAGHNILELTQRTGNELLRKPYTQKQLLHAVRSALGNAPLGDTLLGNALLGNALLGNALLGNALLGNALLGESAPLDNTEGSGSDDRS